MLVRQGVLSMARPWAVFYIATSEGDAPVKTGEIEISEEIYQLARANTKRMFGIRVKQLTKILRDLGQETEDDLPVYMVTNEKAYEGAAAFLDPLFLEKFAEKIGHDFYTLPSSVHEVMFAVKKPGIMPEKIKALVEYANKTVVNEDEFLSNNVYLYDRKEKDIIIMT